MKDLSEFAKATTVVVTRPGTKPSRITLSDCEENPGLRMVRRMGKLAYAVQLMHIKSEGEAVRENSELTAEQKEELLQELAVKFHAVKSEALDVFPE